MKYLTGNAIINVSKHQWEEMQVSAKDALEHIGNCMLELAEFKEDSANYILQKRILINTVESYVVSLRRDYGYEGLIVLHDVLAEKLQIHSVTDELLHIIPVGHLVSTWGVYVAPWRSKELYKRQPTVKVTRQLACEGYW